MRKAIPLNDLERFELLQAIYPERLGDDADFGDEEELLHEMCVDPVSFDEIMGRVALCTMPMSSPISGEPHHVLGSVTIADGRVHMMAAVKREINGD